MNRRTPYLSLLLFLPLVLGDQAAGAAEGVRSWGLGEACRPADWAASESGAEELREAWTFRAQGKDGSRLEAELLQSNQGLDDHKAAFRILFRSDDGQEKRCRGALPSSAWKRGLDEEAEQAWLDMGRVRARLGMGVQDLDIRCDGLEGRLQFQTLGSAWQPGDGRILSRKRGRGIRLAFPSPRARVQGSITAHGGAQAFDGLGWVRHRRQDTAPQDFWRRRMSVHATESRASLHCQILDLVEDLGSSRQSWCVIVDDAGLRLGSARMLWELSDYIRDETKGRGAIIPRRLESKLDGGLSLQPRSLKSASLRVRLGALLKRENPAHRLGSLSRWASQALNSAMDYEFACRVQAELQPRSADQARRNIEFITTCRFQFNRL